MLFTRRDTFTSGRPWLRRAANASLVGRIRSGTDASDQPRSDRVYAADRHVVAAPADAGDRRRLRAAPRDRPGLLPPRIGVHAAARRGHAALHAVDDARHFDRERAAAAADHGSHHQAVSGGGPRARQDRTRRHADRSRAAVDARNGDHPEADRAVAQRSTRGTPRGPRRGWRRDSGA